MSKLPDALIINVDRVIKLNACLTYLRRENRISAMQNLVCFKDGAPCIGPASLDQGQVHMKTASLPPRMN